MSIKNVFYMITIFSFGLIIGAQLMFTFTKPAMLLQASELRGLRAEADRREANLFIMKRKLVSLQIIVDKNKPILERLNLWLGLDVADKRDLKIAKARSGSFKKTFKAMGDGP